MRNRFTLVMASLFGSLCIYCAEGALQPERNANADGSSGGSGAACCDTTPKWTKITEGNLSGSDTTSAYSDPLDVSGYKELSLIRECKNRGVASVDWAAEAGGLFGDLGSGNAGRFAVGAPFVRVSVRSDLMNNTGTCKFVLLGVK